MKTKINSAATLGRVLFCVGLVQSAIRSTAGSMFLDIHVDEDLTESIEAMLKEENHYGKSDGDAVRSVIRRIFGNHEERMIDAARDDANGGMTRALRSLPNAEVCQPEGAKKL